MKKVILFGFFILFSIGMVSASTAPEVEWSKTFGGLEDDYAYSVQQVKDGYVIAGWTSSYGAGGKDVWIVKLDVNGGEVWNKTFGGEYDDYAIDIKQTSDEGYIIFAQTLSYGASIGSWPDYWIIKLDSNGNEEWNKTFGGSQRDRSHAIEQTPDGGYILGGDTYSFGAGGYDIWLIKTDSLGNKEWERTFGGSGWDKGGYVKLTPDGGFIVLGKRGGNVWLIKTDSLGNKEWDRIFDLGTNDDEPHSLDLTPNGYIIAGGKPSNITDVFLLKVDSSGNKEWARAFGGSGFDNAHAVLRVSDGYIIAGTTSSFTGNRDVWVIKTDINGNEEWNKTLGDLGRDAATSIAKALDGYIVAGYTESYGSGRADVWLIKLSSETSGIRGQIKTPGFEAFIAMVGLLTAVYAIRRFGR